MDRNTNGNVQRLVSDLRVGDYVDLEGNIFADPFTDGESPHPEFAFEFQEVCEIEFETPDCTVVHFNNFSCGFPPDHWIDVDGEQILD